MLTRKNASSLTNWRHNLSDGKEEIFGKRTDNVFSGTIRTASDAMLLRYLSIISKILKKKFQKIFPNKMKEFANKEK